MESMGVCVRSYIDFVILLLTTPLVSVLFCSSIPTFCSCFSFCNIHTDTQHTHTLTHSCTLARTHACMKAHMNARTQRHIHVIGYLTYVYTYQCSIQKMWEGVAK